MGKEKYNFMVDYYSNYFINNKPEVVQKMLEIILNKDDLTLDYFQTQQKLTNLDKRSIVLDVLTKDNKGNIYNIEFQNTYDNDLEKRARYHHSMLDVNNLKKNTKFKELKNTYVIFICNFDYFKKGEDRYVIEKNVKDNDLAYKDNQHTIFVNCKYDDLSTDIGKLIHGIISNDDEEKCYNVFKEGKNKGGKIMGDGLERWKNKFRKEGEKKGLAKGRKENNDNVIKGMISENLSNDIISRVCKVSDEYIGKVKKKMNI